ncbi:MAG: phosphoribosylanthranilate isomerase [Candidatus Eremiobacteraeota bacterium]|nr:phosphoribosylanthranilate isomerase [Candidatus Eremiobacteraeota bacterium]MCW5866047.1 phosphoribosylanthranilate isomerase [Candidatus Eremiobacteraeota bacterium]
MTQIKVCGLTRPGDVDLCLELGVERLGFVFAPSPRQITLAQLDDLLERGPFFWSAVLVDPGAQLVEELLARGCPCLQFHGGESAEMLSAYRGRACLVKALRVAHPDHLKVDLPADEYLLDGARPGHGQPFDWSWVRERRPARPFFLAGGLTPDNVAEAIARVAPLGVDVSSGVEEAPGLKCQSRLRAFVKRVRGC